MNDLLNLLSQIDLWFYYFAGSIVLSTLELFLPGFVCLPLGLGALLTVPFAMFLPAWATLLVWTAGTCVSWVGFHKFFPAKATHKYVSNVDGMVGQQARVIEAIDPKSGSGVVKLFGEEWKVFQPSEEVAMGQMVTILQVIGNQVRVEPAMDPDEIYGKKFDSLLHQP
ncbi:MAG: NfeD family protein [SAR324 cluster bacterium]|nr:NfeD family protein [SAR324 cluster bacterium]